MKRYLPAILALTLFGMAKLPVERQLTKDLRDAHFFGAQLNIGLRRQVGQMSFIAALSGFRSVVADGLWLWAHVAWEHTEWGKMKVLFDGATELQPRSLLFWDGASWHMAYNASVAAMNDVRQPREALRIKARDEYYHLGEDYLLRGTEFNPDRSLLFDRLGLLYGSKLKDHCKASWAYFEAAKRPDALTYVHRMAVYELARCGGHDQQAYEMLLELYKKGKRERLPTLLKLLGDLQNKLQIPAAEQIDIAPELREATPK